MSEAAYVQYKDSGVPALGLIPAHWQVQRIKDDIIKIASGVTPTGGAEVYVDEGTPFLRSQNVHDDGLRLGNVSFITEEINSKMRGSQTKPGDIVLNITGASIGRSCVVPDTVKQANISQHILLLRFKKHRVAYAAKYIQSCFIKDYIDTIQVGASKQALNMGQTLNFPLLLPPQEVQAAITDYLDRHTAAIDRKIDLLEQKIKLYQTLRKTLINETVCRGLDPHAPRKDSGIAWIGEIPAHWQVKRLKDVGRVVLGKMLNTTGKAGYALKPYLKSKNITWLKPSIKSVDDMYFSPDELLTYRIKKNDLLISEGGEVGKTCIWNNELPECYIQNSVHKITLLASNSPRYYLYLSFAMGAIGFYDSIVNQVSIKHLTWEKFIRILVLVPPYEEQHAIANHIAQSARKIDTITTNLTTQIATLKELRKTLINDVVTGKLNVTTTA